jgi:translation initiation factor IF-2
MSATSPVKLFKLASELNLGRDAIVDFLKGKGFNIQNKPTETLTGEMVDIVHEKFKREKIVAEKQREKLEKHHILRNAPGTEHKPEKLEESPKVVEEKPKPAPASFPEVKSFEEKAPKPEFSERPKEPVKTEIPAKIEQPDQKQTISQEIPTSKGNEPQVGQVIKLDSTYSDDHRGKKKDKEKFKGSEHQKTETVEKEVTVTKTEKTEPTKEISESPKEKVVIKSQDSQQKSEKKDKFESKKEHTLERKEFKKDDKREDRRDDRREDRKEDRKEEAKELRRDERPSERRSDEKPGEPRKEGDKHKKKRHKVAEVVPGQAPKLRGLTIVGKIELHKGRGDRNRGEFERGKFRKDRPAGDRPPGDFKRAERYKGVPERTTPPVVILASESQKFHKEKEKDLKTKKLIIADDTIAKVPAKLKVKDKIKSKEEKQVKKHKKAIREQISESDVERAVKETMAGMDTGHGAGASRSKIKMKRKLVREEKAAIRMKEDEERANVLELTEFVTTADLARMMDVNPNQIIMKCISLGLMVTINQRLDKDTILLISEDFGYQVEFIDEQAALDIIVEEDAEDSLEYRAPIVTIMGHVDHGKTSLLDYIRRANVVAGEAGGITQHIGAYQVELDGGRMITFLDTPGHAAFTAMRARGAQVTDIVVLVVAADDSVMPQTIEAISHAKAAGVPIVVAINKVDKPDANPDRIKQQLTDYDILVEDWGGKYQSVEISAKFGQNVDTLLDKILVEAELLDLKANPNRAANGAVIEAVMKKGFGPVATIIVQRGTLKVGDSFVAGVAHGKVRTLLDEREKKVEQAGPADPVIVVGFDSLPEAGDTFIVTANDIEARNIAQERSKLKREQELRQIRKISLDDISQKIQQGNVKELKLILKGDVSGSVEALSDSLAKLGQEEVRVLVIHKGVGTILETDVILASASEAVIVGFNVSVDGNARKLADVEKVDIRQYNIIYDCINEINLALEGLLSPEYQEETTSIVEVRQTFKISRIGTIAGCYVQSGKISKSDKIRVLRDGLIVHSGTLSSLKREKDDAKEVDSGFECGIQINNFNDIQVGDSIESYKINEIKRKLK